MGASFSNTGPFHQDAIVASEYTAVCEGTEKMLKDHARNLETLAGLSVNAYTPPFRLDISSDPALLKETISRRYESVVQVEIKVHEEDRDARMDDNIPHTYRNWVYVSAANTRV